MPCETPLEHADRSATATAAVAALVRIDCFRIVFGFSDSVGFEALK